MTTTPPTTPPTIAPVFDELFTGDGVGTGTEVVADISVVMTAVDPYEFFDVIVVGNAVATEVMEVAIGVVPVVTGVVDVGALLLLTEDVEEAKVVVGDADVVGDVVIGTAVTDVG